MGGTSLLWLVRIGANSRLLACYALSVFVDEVGCRSVLWILPGIYLSFTIFIHLCQTSRNYKIFDFLPQIKQSGGTSGCKTSRMWFLYRASCSPASLAFCPSGCSSRTLSVYARTVFCLHSSNLLSERARSWNNLFRWVILDIRNLLQIQPGRYHVSSPREASRDSPESKTETELETWLKWFEPSSWPAVAQDREPSSVLQIFHTQTPLWEHAWGYVTSTIALVL